jgi:drug/metabolite transporter (DMT)-like permease
VIFLGDKLTSMFLLGGILILAGVYITEFWPGAEDATAETAGA